MAKINADKYFLCIRHTVYTMLRQHLIKGIRWPVQSRAYSWTLNSEIMLLKAWHKILCDTPYNHGADGDILLLHMFLGNATHPQRYWYWKKSIKFKHRHVFVRTYMYMYMYAYYLSWINLCHQDKQQKLH